MFQVGLKTVPVMILISSTSFPCLFPYFASFVMKCAIALHRAQRAGSEGATGPTRITWAHAALGGYAPLPAAGADWRDGALTDFLGRDGLMTWPSYTY